MRKDSERHVDNFLKRQGRKHIPVPGFPTAFSSVHYMSEEELHVQGLPVPKHTWQVTLVYWFISTISRNLAFCRDQQRDFKEKFSLTLPRWENSGHALKNRILEKNTYLIWKKPYIGTHMRTASVLISPMVIISAGSTRNILSEKVNKMEIYFYF